MKGNRKLRKKSIAGINKKYTGDIKDRALVQIGKELEIVRKQGSAPWYLAALDVLDAVDAKPEEFCLKGTGGSSLLAYSLGLSDIEPLTASPGLYPELYFGICGEKMPYFEFDVTMNLREPEVNITRAILDARINAGMTQVELSQKSGISQADISRLEKG
ncbi:MAG: helix-turn-helix domain-containing protein, partial [Lachnospiraceae bacterium]|nr:helix-turn-helix domain-containing protein [Lachnospiraceae bacterium]